MSGVVPHQERNGCWRVPISATREGADAAPRRACRRGRALPGVPTSSAHGRGAGPMTPAWQLLDLMPGRDEGALPFPVARVRLREGYGLQAH